jgi:soluble lytic murein transglycosylase
MAQRFDGSTWLASAAYNAGPNRVDVWLAARGTLAPDLFVATIPYKETREYVARVMAFSVIYDWRLNRAVVPLAQRMGPIGQRHVPPGPATPRRAVTCPAPPAAATSVAAPVAAGP